MQKKDTRKQVAFDLDTKALAQYCQRQLGLKYFSVKFW